MEEHAEGVGGDLDDHEFECKTLTDGRVCVVISPAYTGGAVTSTSLNGSSRRMAADGRIAAGPFDSFGKPPCPRATGPPVTCMYRLAPQEASGKSYPGP